MDEQRARRLLGVYRDGLLEDILPFWIEHSVDDEGGGFFTYLDRDGTIVGTDKPIWLQCRIAWLFSRLYNEAEKREEWLALARHALEFVEAHGFAEDGRMFFSVTRDGGPLRKRRYLYTECFGAMAFAEYARATGDERAKQRAIDIYRLILRYHRGSGLLEPKVIPETRSTKSHGMVMMLVVVSQIMRQIDDDPIYTQVIDDSIEELQDHFLKPKFKAVLETVGPNGEFIDEPFGRAVVPGHAIETAWFVMEEGRFRGDQGLIRLGVQVLQWSLEIGWDDEFGGLFYYRDVKGYPCEQYEHDMKLWWPHNEAIYATLLAYHLTRDTSFSEWHERIHDWAYAHFPDREYGEWFGYLHRDGTVSLNWKGNQWKGPFHIPRMQLNCWKLLKEISDT